MEANSSSTSSYKVRFVLREAWWNSMRRYSLYAYVCKCTDNIGVVFGCSPENSGWDGIRFHNHGNFFFFFLFDSCCWMSGTAFHGCFYKVEFFFCCATCRLQTLMKNPFEGKSQRSWLWLLLRLRSVLDIWYCFFFFVGGRWLICQSSTLTISIILLCSWDQLYSCPNCCSYHKDHDSHSLPFICVFFNVLYTVC